VTGHATNIITGLSVGLESTGLPVIVICFAILTSVYLGESAGLTDAKGKVLGGLYGTAIATMGMFSSGVFVLSMSGFGPIADNAGGIVEMSGEDEHVRDITDRLDAVGNVTKANTKGYSVGSASLACFLLFSAYLDEVEMLTGKEFKVIDIAEPPVFVGGLLGSMTVFVFSGWSIAAVGFAAEDVIQEVRRQFKEHPGILNYTEKPDYKQCVALVNKAGLREMIKPGLLAVLAPIVVGLTFRVYGSLVNDSLLGARVTAGFLMFSTSTGILMALFFNNGGGAWDNAKKYIESGKHGGKGSEAHKAAVTGDTVGDPCKDTAGPSIHILIKLLSTITLVMVPLYAGN
jgi:H(+)-translocating pyrophosphatase